MTVDRIVVLLPQQHDQLGYPVSGPTDCAVRAAQSAIEFGTWGESSPAPPVLRPLMGAPVKGGTTIRQALRGIRTFGIRPLRIGRRNRGPWATVVDWLEQDHLVVVYGKYGAIIDGWRALAGSKDYRGGHAIAIYGVDQGQTLSLDSLYDGRRANIPSGPTMVPLQMIEAFTAAAYGAGRASAYAVPLDAVRIELERALAECREGDES